MVSPTHGSPITKLSPAFTDGIKPNDPTRAAAASLKGEKLRPLQGFQGTILRDDIAIEIRGHHHVVDPRGIVRKARVTYCYQTH